MTLSEPNPDEITSVAEFNLWCAMNSKPYKLMGYVWADQRMEWCLEVNPGRPSCTVAYGTGQQDDRFAVMAAFAFLAGLEWAENQQNLAALDETGEAAIDDSAVDPGIKAPDPETAAPTSAAIPAPPVPVPAPVSVPVPVYLPAPMPAAAGVVVVEPALPEFPLPPLPAFEAATAATPIEVAPPSEPPPSEPSEPSAVVQAPGPDGAAGDSAVDGRYHQPSTKLLSLPALITEEVQDEAALAVKARQLETVLRNFGVRGEIMEVRPGPVVTLYELEPAPGTKSSRVITIADDIARSMSAISVRIAVVPGRSVIGIELPNQRRETVYLGEMLASQAYRESGCKLPLVLGKDIGGVPVVVDLARMPHLLIAGTTGSGKSVGINTMILSLIYRLAPEECRFIMVDPKMLELSVYDGIPHLLTPVVTDPKKAVVALKWAVREMEDRYRSMSRLGVRNIEGYNARVTEILESGEQVTRKIQVGFDRATQKPVFEDKILDLKTLPYIVVVVDEMADLMLVAGKDIEAAIQRLAQMARAAGIHLIMATQRPSVDVITGTIKANFPTRVSFQVTSKIDSRTILGESGAEQLLGQGDMLYMAGGGRITRVHGAFVTDTEVEEVVTFVKSQGAPDYIHTITEDDEEEEVGTGGEEGEEGIEATGGSGDELYDQAVALVARERKCSVSFIQRYLQIGYNRSARIVEKMETEGVVSTANHVGKREVLVTRSSVFATRERAEEY